MLKVLGAQIKEFKKDSLMTPVFMILEVIIAQAGNVRPPEG